MLSVQRAFLRVHDKAPGPHRWYRACLDLEHHDDCQARTFLPSGVGQRRSRRVESWRESAVAAGEAEKGPRSGKPHKATEYRSWRQLMRQFRRWRRRTPDASGAGRRDQHADPSYFQAGSGGEKPAVEFWVWEPWGAARTRGPRARPAQCQRLIPPAPERLAHCAAPEPVRVTQPYVARPTVQEHDSGTRPSAPLARCRESTVVRARSPT